MMSFILCLIYFQRRTKIVILLPKLDLLPLRFNTWQRLKAMWGVKRAHEKNVFVVMACSYKNVNTSDYLLQSPPPHSTILIICACVR
mmetsp:Transcript_15615/g.20007  ORF Transcript_15615/g.20007 Transcript_15615/m.20007 type:complete len:87 (+) Transcript_15615:436-696(+)